MTSLPPIGYVGRALAGVGALLVIVSLFVDYTEGSSASLWDLLRRMDVVILVLAILAILLVLGSLFMLGNLMLFAVGAIGGFGLGFFSPDFIEYTFDKGIGAYLAILGSAAILGGAALALAPVLVARAGNWRDLPFVHEETPRPVAQPAPGWYADPSGQARLRYWDGQRWSEQIQQ